MGVLRRLGLQPGSNCVLGGGLAAADIGVLVGNPPQQVRGEGSALGHWGRAAWFCQVGLVGLLSLRANDSPMKVICSAPARPQTSPRVQAPDQQPPLAPTNKPQQVAIDVEIGSGASRGGIMAKQRLLTHLGWRSCCIRAEDWRQLGGSAEKQQRFVELVLAHALEGAASSSAAGGHHCGPGCGH